MIIKYIVVGLAFLLVFLILLLTIFDYAKSKPEEKISRGKDNKCTVINTNNKGSDPYKYTINLVGNKIGSPQQIKVIDPNNTDCNK